MQPQSKRERWIIRLIHMCGFSIVAAFVFIHWPHLTENQATPPSSPVYQDAGGEDPELPAGFCVSGLESLDIQTEQSAGNVIHLRNVTADFVASLIVRRVECESEGAGCFACETRVRTRNGRPVPSALQESCDLFPLLYERAVTEFPEEAVSLFEHEIVLGLAYMLFETTGQRTCDVDFYYDPRRVFPGSDPNDAL